MAPRNVGEEYVAGPGRPDGVTENASADRVGCETDSVRMWIADPRFPLPAALVRNPRLLLSRGPALKMVDLAKAIPMRFADAYEAAEIFYVGGETVDAA